MHTCIHTHIHTYTHSYTYIPSLTYTHTYIHTITTYIPSQHPCICTYIHSHTHTHTHKCTAHAFLPHTYHIQAKRVMVTQEEHDAAVGKETTHISHLLLSLDTRFVLLNQALMFCQHPRTHPVGCHSLSELLLVLQMQGHGRNSGQVPRANTHTHIHKTFVRHVSPSHNQEDTTVSRERGAQQQQPTSTLCPVQYTGGKGWGKRTLIIPPQHEPRPPEVLSASSPFAPAVFEFPPCWETHYVGSSPPQTQEPFEGARFRQQEKTFPEMEE